MYTIIVHHSNDIVLVLDMRAADTVILIMHSSMNYCTCTLYIGTHGCHVTRIKFGLQVLNLHTGDASRESRRFRLRAFAFRTIYTR